MGSDLACTAAAVHGGQQEAPGFKFDPGQNIIPTPADPAASPAFRQSLALWRDQTRARLKYDDRLYRRPEFAWSTANFSCCFLMVCDLAFYDAEASRYTVEAFLDHGPREFGGYDSVVLWQAYPRIGVDQRNQFDFYRDLPGGLRHKWLERRHMQHQIRRWDFDHSAELHAAWMNGSGMIVWENVFGSCVPWNARDRSTLRTMLPIQRRFRAVFCGEDWTPLVPTARQGVFASLWGGAGTRIWTLVNRGNEEAHGELLRVPEAAGTRYYDLVAGREEQAGSAAGTAVLSGTLPPRGIGCFVSGDDASLGADFRDFLQQQAGLNARADQDTKPPQRRTQLRPPMRAKALAAAPGSASSAAVRTSLPKARTGTSTAALGLPISPPSSS